MPSRGKMKLINSRNYGFASLLGLVITLMIICVLVYFIFNVYFKMPGVDEETKEAFSQHGIDSSSYKTILDSTQGKVQDLNKQLRDRTKAIEELR